MNLQDMIIKTLTDHDNSRDRSRQVEVGPSSIGGCHRRLYHEIARTEPTNAGDKLGAICGTFIHTGIESALKRLDPFNDNYLTEVEVEHEGLRGHVDLFIKDQGLVVDWKSTKKGSARYFGAGNRQHRWQVHLYGWLLENNGYDVKGVSIVGIPRDGKMKDILVFAEDYNPAIAQEAIDHLAKTKNMVAENLPPAPEKTLNFCADYCPYYDPTGEIGCPSIVK